MAGVENSLDIILDKDKIAKIYIQSDQLIWEYSESWHQAGYAVSPHLPLQGEVSSLNVQRFLRNMLPEGNALDELITCFHLSKSNTFGLIRALGLDIAGALIIVPTAQTYLTEPTFRRIGDEELKQRLDERDDFSLLIWDGKPRLSVAGVQDKINVILTPEGTLGFGEGSLCSTHILKFEKQKLAHLALNEYITMELAKHTGLKVANTQLMHFGNHATLLVERFDRQLISMREVKRRHFIDGCQALNLPPEYKYERNFGSGRDVTHIREGVSYKKLFDFSNQCSNPALTKQKILDWALFNVLVCNYDSHGKNIGFFVSEKGISLAPFYDLVNIKMYPDFEHEMAMAFGDEFDSENINAYQLADFAETCRLQRSLVAKRLKYLIAKVKYALEKQIDLTFKDEEEGDYFIRYRNIVYERCEHLLKQADEMASIAL